MVRLPKCLVRGQVRVGLTVAMAPSRVCWSANATELLSTRSPPHVVQYLEGMRGTSPVRAHCFPHFAFLARLAGYKCNQGFGGGGGGRRSAGSAAFSKKIAAVDFVTGL